MVHDSDLFFLLGAIKNRVPVDIDVARPTGPQHFFSRFCDLHADETSIYLECPRKKGVYHRTFRKGDRIWITFQNFGFRLRFESTVIETGDRQVSDSGVLPVIRIAFPDILQDGDRRGMFRATIRTRDLVQVAFNRIADPDGAGQPGIPGRTDNVQAVMMDLSEKGMAIQISGESEVGPGDHLRFSFTLGKEAAAPVVIEGIVRNIRKGDDRVSQFLGIEFLTRKNRQDRQNLQRIAAYAMAHRPQDVRFDPMERIVSRNYLVQKIADGDVPDEVSTLLMDGRFSLTHEEQLEALVYISGSDRHREQALSLIQHIPTITKQVYAERSYANHRVVSTLLNQALETANHAVIKSVVKNTSLPVQFLLKIAREGSTRALGMLLREESKLVAYPEILEVMRKNTHLTPQMVRRIESIRQRYADRNLPEDIPRHPVIQEVIREVERGGAAEGSSSTRDDDAGIGRRLEDTLQRINSLSMGERIKLAFHAHKMERLILARDPNQIVLAALIENPEMTEGEVISLLHAQTTGREIVYQISQLGKWRRMRRVVKALVSNPKLPLKISLALVSRLTPEDMGDVLQSETVLPDVRDAVEQALHRS